MADRQLFPWNLHAGLGVNNGPGLLAWGSETGRGLGSGLAGFHKERGRGEPVTGVEQVGGGQTGSAG